MRWGAKRSTPYSPGAVHDFMHAKCLVADDTVFVGSFNFSHSGEENAENVLEIRSAEVADRFAVYVDALATRYAPARAPVELEGGMPAGERAPGRPPPAQS